MSELNNISAETLELLERRIGERVEEQVRARLFKFYLSIGSAVLAAAGFFGWSVISDLRTGLEDAFKHQIVDPYQAKLDEIDDKLASADAIQDTTNRTLLRIEDVISSAAPKMTSIEIFSEKIDNLDTKTMDLRGQLAEIESSAQAANEVTRQVPELADELNKLALSVAALQSQGTGATDGSEPTPTVVTAETEDAATDASMPQADPQQVIANSQSIKEATTKAVETINAASTQNTVFLQYYGMPKETAEAIRDDLAKAGFLLPGVDQEPMSQSGLSQIRYYYDADEPAAALLAKETQAILQAMSLGAREVTVASYTDWPRQKPRPGTLELWIGIPARAAE